jgi:hypothetical protein
MLTRSVGHAKILSIASPVPLGAPQDYAAESSQSFRAFHWSLGSEVRLRQGSKLLSDRIQAALGGFHVAILAL